jgi:hypothetical protein
MSASKFQRPADDDYYVDPWSDTFLQGDVFKDVPIAITAPPDAVVMAEGERRFVSGPFDAGPAMLISPSCAIAAQGTTGASGAYAHPARMLIPIRSVGELVAAGAVVERNLGNLRADRLRNYLYLPATEHYPESAALLYLVIGERGQHLVVEGAGEVAGVAGQDHRAVGGEHSE